MEIQMHFLETVLRLICVGLATDPGSSPTDDHLPISQYMEKRSGVRGLEGDHPPTATATRTQETPRRPDSSPPHAASHSDVSTEDPPPVLSGKRKRAAYVPSSSEEDCGTARARVPQGGDPGGSQSRDNASSDRSPNPKRRALARNVIEDSSGSEDGSLPVSRSPGGLGEGRRRAAQHVPVTTPSAGRANSGAEEGEDGEEGGTEGGELSREPASARKRLRQRGKESAEGPEQAASGQPNLWETPERGLRTRRNTRGQLRSSRGGLGGGAPTPVSPQDGSGSVGGGTEVRRTQRKRKEVARVKVGNLRDRQREQWKRLEAESEEEASDVDDPVVDLTRE